MAARFDPFRDFDRLAERMMSAASSAEQSMRAMPIDLYRDGDHWVLHCDLPGVDPESLDIGVDERVLTIRAERVAREGEVEWLIRERATGMFARQLTLGHNVDVESITADYADGVLTLRLPVAEAAKPRKITVAGSRPTVMVSEVTQN